MKEIVGTSANMALLEGNKNNLIGMAEVILVFSEPQYQTDGGGGIVKVRAAQHIRFSAAAKNLRKIAEQFTEYADELEKLENRATLLGGDDHE